MEKHDWVKELSYKLHSEIKKIALLKDEPESESVDTHCWRYNALHLTTIRPPT